jgi:hypothetical protein
MTDSTYAGLDDLEVRTVQAMGDLHALGWIAEAEHAESLLAVLLSASHEVDAILEPLGH